MNKALSLKKVTKQYAGGLTALNCINLEVDQGEFFALLGPNGAGKSTTLNVISSMVRKTSGSVSIQGIDIDTHPYHSRQALGIVPQEFNFGGFETPREILHYSASYFGVPHKKAKQNSERLLSLLGLWEKRNVRSISLSGGMKRRLMIARALMHEPSILMLDEPTAGVDIEVRQSMWAFIKELNANGTTIILTTHHLEEAEALCNEVAIINEGSIARRSSMSALLSELECEQVQLSLINPSNQKPDLPPYCSNWVSPYQLDVSLLKSQSIADICDRLKQHNITVHRADNKSTRLEQSFLQLISKEAEHATH